MMGEGGLRVRVGMRGWRLRAHPTRALRLPALPLKGEGLVASGIAVVNTGGVGMARASETRRVVQAWSARQRNALRGTAHQVLVARPPGSTAPPSQHRNAPSQPANQHHRGPLPSGGGAQRAPASEARGWGAPAGALLKVRR